MSAYLANLLGALASGVGDLQQQALCGNESSLDCTTLEALLAVHAHAGASVREIATIAGLSHSGAVRAVDRLVAHGFVARRRSCDDGRAVALRLTDQGEAMATAALAARRQALEGLLMRLDTGQKSTLDRLLRILLSQLPSSVADARRICRLCEHAVCRGDACPVGSSGRAREDQGAAAC